MRDSQYYSVRTGINKKGAKPDLETINLLFFNLFKKYKEEGYFYEYFGYSCVDGEIKGKLGSDIGSIMFLKLRKINLWPFNISNPNYAEDDLFDIIEFTYDCVSKPISGYYHSYSDCGHHFDVFNQSEGKKEFKKEVNSILKDYQSGYEMSTNGEIISSIDEGFENLFDAKIPAMDSEIQEKINHAILKFRRYKSSLHDRRDAIRELADVLEFLRPQAEKVLTKEDDSTLFNLANNFGIRHHNQRPKDQYNKPIWYSWLFYFYLATIHAVLRFIEEKESVTCYDER